VQSNPYEVSPAERAHVSDLYDRELLLSTNNGN